MSISIDEDISTHVLQHRDPARIDWQIAVYRSYCHEYCYVWNNTYRAGFLSLTSHYAGAALPLAALAAVLLIEIPSSIRQTMMQVEHDWARFRALMLAGAVIGNATACL